MAIIASKKGGSDFTPISAGVHLATCISVIDLGVQTTTWQGQEKKQHKVYICWEAPDETVLIDGEERPRIIGRDYTLSLGEKSVLRAHLEAWRGKTFTEEELDGFDLVNILGKPCQLSVVHTEKNGKTYANINAIMSLPKGMNPPPLMSETTYFDLGSEECLSMMEALPQWIQEKIKAGDTYQELISINNSDDYVEVDSDDLPFN